MQFVSISHMSRLKDNDDSRFFLELLDRLLKAIHNKDGVERYIEAYAAALPELKEGKTNYYGIWAAGSVVGWERIPFSENPRQYFEGMVSRYEES